METLDLKAKRIAVLKERAEAIKSGSTLTKAELKKEVQLNKKSKAPSQKVKKAKSPTKPKRLTEDELMKKYKHVIKGTLRFDEKSNKASVDIKCSDCKGKRNVHTSDLFQVTRCFECTTKARRQRQKANVK